VLLAIAAMLGAFGLWVNASLALVYQGLIAPVNLQQRTEMVAFQYRVDQLFGGRPRDVVFSSVLPKRVGTAFTTLVVGSCSAVYWSDGENWWELEGQPASGVFQLHVEFPHHLGREWQPILATGNDQLVVGVRDDDGRYEFGIGYQGPTALSFVPGVEYRSLRSANMEIVVSNPRHDISVLIDGSDVADLPIPAHRSIAPYQLGVATRAGAAHYFGGTVTGLAPQLTLCRELQRRRGVD
jgi:hypothetical protein